MKTKQNWYIRLSTSEVIGRKRALKLSWLIKYLRLISENNKGHSTNRDVFMKNAIVVLVKFKSTETSNKGASFQLFHTACPNLLISWKCFYCVQVKGQAGAQNQKIFKTL